MMKRQRRQQQETVPPADGSKETQKKGNGGENTTQIQLSPVDQQGGYKLQGQAVDSELDPSRRLFYKVEGEGRG